MAELKLTPIKRNFQETKEENKACKNENLNVCSFSTETALYFESHPSKMDVKVAKYGFESGKG